MQYYLLISFLTFFACTQESDFKKIENFDFKSKTDRAYTLPSELNEISGLAVSNDDRLFAHNDEKGYVYQLSRKGEVLKSFQVGDPVLAEDFEGIAIVNSTFYMVNSKGDIFEFEEGADQSIQIYEKYKTHLSSKNDIEGLCYYPATNSLLLITKADPDIKGKNKKTIWSFSLENKKLKKKPWLTLDIKKLKKLSIYNEFAPSGIEYHKQRDSFYIIAANGHSIAEINSKGEILAAEKLNSSHKQVEGVSFFSNGDIVISDEGRKGNAYIHIYESKQQ